jgi:hypothetical protein
MAKTTLYVALVLCAAGCGPILQYNGAPPAPALRGRVIVDVHDGREVKAGGDKPEEVGFGDAGAFGIPAMLRVDGPTVVADTMRQLVTDAARAAGIGITDGPGATARVVVDVQRLWCAGYGGFQGTVTASISVLDPSGQQIRVPGARISAADGGIKCRRIFKHALSEFFRSTRAMFSDPNVAVRLTQ